MAKRKKQSNKCDNKDSNIMVCVTQQKTCEKLINKGVSLKKNQNEKANIYIINVVKENENFLYNSSEGEALEYLFSIARKADADLTVIRNDDVTRALADFAKSNEIGCAVLGASPNIKGEDNHPIIKALKDKLGDGCVEYVVV